MTVTQTKKLSRRRASIEVTKDGQQRTYFRDYLVKTDDPNDTEETIRLSLLNSDGVDLGTFLAHDLGARIDHVDLHDIGGDPQLWKARFRFRSITGDDPEDFDKDPTLREPRVSVRFSKVQVPLEGNFQRSSQADKGFLDQAFGAVNSKGQRFNPPPTYTVTVPTIQVIVDEATLNLAGLESWQDKLNSDVFLGFKARTLLLNVADIQERFENNQRIWRKTFEMAFNQRTWDLFILDHGIVDDGNGVFREVLLDGNGEITTEPTYLKFTPYEAIVFATSAPAAVLKLSGIQ